MMYYESHITINPVYGEQLVLVKSIAGASNFKVAHLLMKKREEDTAERSMFDTFMTGHGSEGKFADIEERMIKCINDLQDADIAVWRYKIEEVTIDSRHTDIYGLLSPKENINE